VVTERSITDICFVPAVLRTDVRVVLPGNRTFIKPDPRSCFPVGIRFERSSSVPFHFLETFRKYHGVPEFEHRWMFAFFGFKAIAYVYLTVSVYRISLYKFRIAVQ